MNCEACNKYISSAEALKCYLCSRFYHYLCINMTSAKFRELNKKKWQCPSCDNVTKRYDNATNRIRGDETPTRRQFEQLDAHAPVRPEGSAPPTASSATTRVPMEVCEAGQAQRGQVISYEQFGLLLDSKLDTKLSSFKEEITREFNQILSQLRENVQLEVTALRNENAKLREDITSLQKAVPPLSTMGDTGLMEAITGFQRQLNERDQELLSNDVEITGVPECDGESTGHVAITVATKLGMVIEERDIVSALRVGPKRGPVEGAPISRPRPIVLRLTRRSLRDNLIKSARVRRGATTADLGLPPHAPQRFYINERLTKINRALFGKARDAAREAQWRFVWSRDGRVYCRRNQASERIIIRSEEDVKNFIKI